jgi:hypothetical protein
VSRIYFQDPGDGVWHTLVWEHATDVAVPFSAETLAYARRLALAQGRHVDERSALAGLLERWDTGLVRHPAERRMAIRASEQRQARLAAATGADGAAEVSALPAVRAITEPDTASLAVIGVNASQLPADAGGDDDTEAELDSFAADEPALLSDEDFYAGALEVLR